jgi:amino acid transporter
MGWLYWYSFGILVAHGITAAALVIDYWPKSVQVAVWITIMFVVVIDLNFFPVKVYGETEFWLASLKVFMIIGLLILSFILFWVGGPDNQRLGFHDRKDLGAMNAYLMTGNTGRFCAYLYVLCYPVFSFNFTPELLVIAAGE